MDKKQKAVALQRISNYYQFNQRNHRILEKMMKLPQSHLYGYLGGFQLLTEETLGAFKHGRGCYFNMEIKDRVTGVTAKHWDAFWAQCEERNRIGFTDYKGLAPVVTSLALPGLDEDRLIHLGINWCPDLVDDFVRRFCADRIYTGREFVDQFLETLELKPEALSMEDYNALVHVLEDPMHARDVRNTYNSIAVGLSFNELGAA